MLDVVTGVEENLTLTVELDGLARFVDAISTLQVLLRTLG